MPINASVDVLNSKMAEAHAKVNDVLMQFGKGLGEYGFVGTVNIILTATVSGKDTVRPMYLKTETEYGFKSR